MNERTNSKLGRLKTHAHTQQNDKKTRTTGNEEHAGVEPLKNNTN